MELCASNPQGIVYAQRRSHLHVGTLYQYQYMYS